MYHSRQHLGRRGEDLACRYLQYNGYTIIARNYRTKLGEIDIVARDGETLVFIEVKTRSGKTYGPPAASVTTNKQRQISRVALNYLSAHKLTDSPARFDVVSVLIFGTTPQIELITDAFDLCQ
ncbi:MAG: YraN family protein [Desulforhopalus sp.]